MGLPYTIASALMSNFHTHDDKVTIVKCNPVASGIVATVGQDHVVKIWNISDSAGDQVTQLSGHGDQVYSVAWSLCGRFIATSCKDGKIRYKHE